MAYLCGLTPSREAERSTRVWCPIATRVLQILDSTTLFLRTSSLFFYCGKQESPLPQHWERQNCPVVGQKVFQAAKQFVFVTVGTTLKKKIKIFEKTNKLIVCIPVDLQASMRMFCLKSLHIMGKVQGRYCSEALCYKWFQRISQRPSEQAKARLVGVLNLLVRSR